MICRLFLLLVHGELAVVTKRDDGGWVRVEGIRKLGEGCLIVVKQGRERKRMIQNFSNEILIVDLG